MPAEPLLAGVTVLDFSRVLAGPYCTRLLADLGARVIKIERPGEGDEMRRGYLQLEPGRSDQSTYFTRVNAGKESVAVDLARPEGQAIVRDLARVADVAVENFMPGVGARLGCGWGGAPPGPPRAPPTPRPPASWPPPTRRPRSWARCSAGAAPAGARTSTCPCSRRSSPPTA